MKNLVTATILTLAASSAFAGTAPTIKSACVMQHGNVLSVSGLLMDLDGDAISVGPLVVGICAQGFIPNYAYGASYNCNVPANATSVTLVAGDAESNYSAPVVVDLTNAPSCEFF